MLVLLNEPFNWEVKGRDLIQKSNVESKCLVVAALAHNPQQCGSDDVLWLILKKNISFFSFVV